LEEKSLIIPSRITELLSHDAGLHSTVLETIATVSPWAQENKTVFFPEYTDHSLVHMSDVLAAADSIISDESWPLISTQDVAAIALSVLLHDCALHLTEDGFFSLVSGSYPGFSSKCTARS
jgi:molecular chaperone HtpG